MDHLCQTLNLDYMNSNDHQHLTVLTIHLHFVTAAHLDSYTILPLGYLSIDSTTKLYLDLN